jgi:MFS transporter, ACS family, aldohexuronate transporter
MAISIRARWVALAFAFVATVINYLDRQTLSVMAPILLAQFHTSAETYSQIIFAFMLAYVLMNGVSGRLLDWMGSKAGYAPTMALCSGAEMLHALTAEALSLGAFRFLTFVLFGILLAISASIVWNLPGQTPDRFELAAEG